MTTIGANLYCAKDLTDVNSFIGLRIEFSFSSQKKQLYQLRAQVLVTCQFVAPNCVIDRLIVSLIMRYTGQEMLNLPKPLLRYYST